LRAKVSVFAELHRRVQQWQALNYELRRLSHSLMTAQDEERRRIARELHDGLGQDLTAAKMMLGALIQPQQSPEAKAQAAREANVMMDHAIQQVRTMSHLLHPPLLDEMGLLSALRWHVEGFMKRSCIETTLDVPHEFPRLEPEFRGRHL
jgi:signal transduction histidine kinase